MSNNASTEVATANQVNLLELASAAISASVVAADQITALATNEGDSGKNIRLKEDGSYVTNADLAAQQIIVQSLRKVSPLVRLVGEESEEEMSQFVVTGHEGREADVFQLAQQEVLMRYQQTNGVFPLAETDQDDNAERPPQSMAPLEEHIVDAQRVSVFIDPLDGTKAYARGDYDPVSILIAIILDQTPCFGVICKPFGYRGQPSILDTGCVAIYGGTLLGGAYAAGGNMDTTPIDGLPRAVISSSRSQGIVQEFVTHLGDKGMIDPTPLMISGAGEKSLRIILRAENEGLWFFPKAGTSLWDVAASDALLRATGGRLTDKNGNDMDYSKSRLEAENEDGVVACFDSALHAECIKLFLEGDWTES